MKTKLLLIGSVILLQCCAGYQAMKLSAVPSTEQQVGYRETITSQKKHFVSLAPYGKRNLPYSKTSFVLFVKNCGEDPINISTDNVSVIFKGSTNKWASQRIAVLSLDDLLNEAIRERNQREMRLRLSSAQTYYYNVYDNYGNIVRTVMRRGELPPAVYILGKPHKQMALIEELVIKTQTLLPGESDGGLVVFDTESMNSNVKGDFQVSVLIDGEEHKFTFDRGLYE